MQVSSAYISVVLIWSTTPLAIHLSNSSLSFVAAISVRMVLALVICLALLKLLGQPLIKERKDWLVYAASGFGLFPNMLLLYWAALYIPSGLMSVLMGIYPFFVGIMSIIVLRQNPFNVTRICALLLAVLGLVIIHHEQMQLGPQAAVGVMVLVLACVLWAVSTVLVKKLGAQVGPLRQGTGSLVVAAPFFAISWLVLDGEVPALDSLDSASIGGVMYLVIMGSVVSHTLWFYVLRECTAISVSLVTLITPILAMTWGYFFAGETLSSTTVIGASIICFALMLYQGILALLWRNVTKLIYRVGACDSVKSL